jgi:hypothetical protein
MSNRGRFLRAAIFLPLAGPVLGYPMLAAFEFAPPLGLVGLFLVGSAQYAWTSYLPLAIGVLVWARGRGDEQLESAARVLPLVYAPVAGVHEALSYARPWFSGSWWADFATGVALGLVFGYAYVLIALLVAERFDESNSVQSPRAGESSRAGT